MKMQKINPIAVINWGSLSIVILFLPLIALNMYLHYKVVSNTNTAEYVEREIFAMKSRMLEEGFEALTIAVVEEETSPVHLVLAGNGELKVSLSHLD